MAFKQRQLSDLKEILLEALQRYISMLNSHDRDCDNFGPMTVLTVASGIIVTIWLKAVIFR